MAIGYGHNGPSDCTPFGFSLIIHTIATPFIFQAEHARAKRLIKSKQFLLNYLSFSNGSKLHSLFVYIPTELLNLVDPSGFPLPVYLWSPLDLSLSLSILLVLLLRLMPHLITFVLVMLFFLRLTLTNLSMPSRITLNQTMNVHSKIPF